MKSSGSVHSQADEKKFKKVGDRFVVNMDEKLGEGNFGQVYMAYDSQNQSGRALCVKLIPVNTLNENPAQKKVIEREIETLLLLKKEENPNLVR
jgi:hypothetical protein